MPTIMPPTLKSDPKERPILFSGPMVRATREGRKTKTRRIVKGDPPTVISNIRTPQEKVIVPDWWFSYCPYGKPGDRLWVRETAKATATEEGFDCIHYAADDFCREITNDEIERWRKMRGYRKGNGSWVTSIHMPRWASRITLEITGVRVERLNDITEADAMAEGFRFDSSLMGPWEGHATAREAFRSLWGSINGQESWVTNPWVWVVEFKRLEVAQ